MNLLVYCSLLFYIVTKPNFDVYGLLNLSLSHSFLENVLVEFSHVKILRGQNCRIKSPDTGNQTKTAWPSKISVPQCHRWSFLTTTPQPYMSGYWVTNSSGHKKLKPKEWQLQKRPVTEAYRWAIHVIKKQAMHSLTLSWLAWCR